MTPLGLQMPNEAVKKPISASPDQASPIQRIESQARRVHAQSVPQFRSLLIDLLPQPGFGKLFNVVHHAIQAPLRVDLLAPPVIQTDQALVVTDVGKHRLDRSKALAVELPAFG